MFGFLLAGVIVDVGQRVEFVDNDIDIITANAVRLASDSLAFICTSDGVELATANLMLDAVEVGCNGINTSGVANENHLVSQEFGLQMKVKT